jgi:hypothetical protein
MIENNSFIFRSLIMKWDFFLYKKNGVNPFFTILISGFQNFDPMN